MLSKFKMHFASMVITLLITSNEEKYDALELADGKVICVRNYCERNDAKRLIRELGLEANII